MHLRTIAETAEYLKVSSQMVYKLARGRILSSYHVGRLIRIDEKDIEEYLKKHRLELEE